MSDQAISDIARTLVGLRHKEQKTCPRCGAVFIGLKTKTYCSHPCAVAQYRDDHRDAVNASRRQRYRNQKRDPQQTS